jgi:ribosomal protein S18 acetylase RimI-like enzyme
MTDTVPIETFTIRHVQLNDLPALEWDGQYHHYRAVFQRAFDEAQAGQRVLLLAEAAEAVVGQVFVQLNSSEQQFADGAGRGYIYALRVRSEWRNHGLGSRLVQAAEDELRARGFQTAVIAAGKDNPDARRLYERLGYRVFTEDPGVWYFTDVNGVQQVLEEPCWVMEKSLT